MNTAICTTFYNPCGYKNPVRNYRMFRDGLGPLAEHLHTIELSFDGQYEIPGAVRVRGTDKNLMWQKERLLNLLVEKLPPQYTCIAWLDCDLLFENSDWYHDAELLLKEKPAVQLFDGIQYTDSDLTPIFRKPGFVSQYSNGRSIEVCNPGAAWAARREVFPLNDANVIGGGDNEHTFSFIGQRRDWTENQMTEAWMDHGAENFNRIASIVRGRVAHLDGDVTHLYHGSRENRDYANRWLYLSDNGFNPHDDIRVGRNGLLEWSSGKTELHRIVRDYFGNRREDEEWVGGNVALEIEAANYSPPPKPKHSTIYRM